MSSNAADIPVVLSEASLAGPALAASITREASRQTFYTIRMLVDHGRVDDAYRAYAYFRWVDDSLDGDAMDTPARRAFVDRQKALVERCYRAELPADLSAEEMLLADLVRADLAENGGVRSAGLELYIRNMMSVMEFDAGRRGQLVDAASLNRYTSWLAIAVTEALHHFIGHGSAPAHSDARYAAVTAAHITHMLRDTVDDAANGYFNIPREVVEAQHIDPFDPSSAAYRAWVRSRVGLARALFARGRDALARAGSARCRLACHAYIARFEVLLDLFEREDYQLRANYPERKTPATALWITHSALAQTFLPHRSPHPERVLSYR